MCCRWIWKAGKGLRLHVKRESRLVHLTQFTIYSCWFLWWKWKCFSNTRALPACFLHTALCEQWQRADRKERTHLCSPPSLAHFFCPPFISLSASIDTLIHLLHHFITSKNSVLPPSILLFNLSLILIISSSRLHRCIIFFISVCYWRRMENFFLCSLRTKLLI